MAIAASGHMRGDTAAWGGAVTECTRQRGPAVVGTCPPTTAAPVRPFSSGPEIHTPFPRFMHLSVLDAFGEFRFFSVWNFGFLCDFL